MTNPIDNTNSFHIWEGIYTDFKSAMADARGLGFGGDVYRTRSLQAVKECMDALKSRQPIPAFHKQRSTQLPIAVAMLLGDKKQIKILDFGGGLGIGYLTLAESIPNDLTSISYTIVEVPEVCRIARELHDSGVIYTSEMPTAPNFDLIHAASSIQYIDHWQKLVAKFVELEPQYILISDVFAGNIKTFVALQNYYESKIPHWFLSLDELLNTFNVFGYGLIMKSYATSRRLDAEDVLPMENYPADLQLPQTLHLLFKKSINVKQFG
jgi:putative methyltransferase (TIGR04325 family)